MEGEFDRQLPVRAIQRIQSFLATDEAAQTTVLSKPWRAAWLTRPSLDFDQSRFGLRGHYLIDKMVDFADKTLKRYEDSNSKIESFRLCMDTSRVCFSKLTTELISTATKLIVRALNIGATHLTVQFNSSDTVFSNEVFASETLVSLSVKRCQMANLEPDQKVTCSSLRSLRLEDVDIEDPSMICRVISSCPLIEKIELSYFYPTQRLGDDAAVAIMTDLRFHRLRSLSLLYLDFDTLFLGDFSSYFPSLKDLTLYMCFKEAKEGKEVTEILISSASLEVIDFKYDSSASSVDIFDKSLSIKFDVPSIRKFSFTGSVFPLMNFISDSKGWESNVTVTRFKGLTPLWFRKLSKFLTKLKRSRIHLFLHIHTEMIFDYKVGDIEGLPKRKIENLTIDHESLPSLSCYALFDGLFRICRPKVINQSLPMCSRGKANNFGFLGQRLLQGLNCKISTPSQFMYGLNDLKEVRAQVFKEAVSTWCDVPLESLHNDTDDTQMKRFHLKWKPNVELV